MTVWRFHPLSPLPKYRCENMESLPVVNGVIAASTRVSVSNLQPQRAITQAVGGDQEQIVEMTQQRVRDISRVLYVSTHRYQRIKSPAIVTGQKLLSQPNQSKWR